ncbi:MAG: transposase [Oscillospiraceae bacterium]|jgi:hypothetical protein|nr:transposase [Oscillospiraceae bacterium]
MSQETGRGEISARIAFGAISLRQSERLSDEDTVRYIQENPYVQYYLGLHEFHMEPLFDPSMMVHFRKRFPIEFIAKVNEYICTGKWPEDIRKVDRNDDEPGKGSGGSGSETSSVEANTAPNSGTLIMDATVAGADIKYPTDIDLLNQCREHLETAIDLLWPYVSHEQHKYPYNRKKARQSFLNISKSKKWTAKKLHTGIGQQLLYDFFENVWRSYRENRNII